MHYRKKRNQRVFSRNICDGLLGKISEKFFCVNDSEHLTNIDTADEESQKKQNCAAVVTFLNIHAFIEITGTNTSHLY